MGLFRYIKNSKLKKHQEEMKLKYWTQKYPIMCKSKTQMIMDCYNCPFRGETQCECPYPFTEIHSSNIEEFVLLDKDYRGISTYSDFRKKIEVANKKKQVRYKKLEAKQQLLQAGAAYLAALDLCKELGLNIKEI